jgi:hypothetical protein
MNINIYSSVLTGHRRIYERFNLTLIESVYSSVRSRHRWIYVSNIHRWRDLTDEYRHTHIVKLVPYIFIHSNDVYVCIYIRRLIDKYRQDLETGAFPFSAFSTRVWSRHSYFHSFKHDAADSSTRATASHATPPRPRSRPEPGPLPPEGNFLFFWFFSYLI